MNRALAFCARKQVHDSLGIRRGWVALYAVNPFQKLLRNLDL